MTQAFDVLCTAVAKGSGFESLRRYVLPHPLNPLPEDRVRSIARESLQRVVAQLLVAAP